VTGSSVTGSSVTGASVTASSVTGSSVTGRLFSSAFGLVQRLRRPRPIHSHGVALVGTLRFVTQSSPSGVAFFDHPRVAELAVTARVSRSLGVPAPLPDVIGLALRFDTADGPADVTLASTGFGVPSRFWLAPQRSPSRARFTTLLPYRSRRGPLLLAARTIEPADLPSSPDALAAALERTTWRLRLYHATPLGQWRAVAVLELGRAPGPTDTSDRYDPVRHVLPGAKNYPWVVRLREPSYAQVQEESR
jgi:hypothetical protein